MDAAHKLNFECYSQLDELVQRADAQAREALLHIKQTSGDALNDLRATLGADGSTDGSFTGAAAVSTASRFSCFSRLSFLRCR